MTSFGKLPHLFIGLAFLFSLIAVIGCDTDLQNRITAVENELSATESELRIARSELDDLEIDLADAQSDLRDCQINTPEGFGALRINNDNPTFSIWEVYVSPTTSDVWGRDWTEEFGDILYGGDTVTYVLEPDTYDVLIVFSDGTEFEEQVTIQSGKEASLRYF